MNTQLYINSQLHNMLRIKTLIIISGILFLLCSTRLNAAQQTGVVSYVRGAVTSQTQNDGSHARLLVKGNKLNAGDVVKTGPKSFAMLKLADGTRLTIRPSSSFTVEQMNAKKNKTASAIIRLFRGGLRAITGFISKKNPRGYRLRTPVATIGIRGTEFDARLCGKDCADENRDIYKNKKPPRPVAKVIYQRGKMKAISFDDTSRQLSHYADIFEGDTLITDRNSFAVIAFRDKSRVTLQANTRFRIDEMRFDKAKPEKSSSLFSLLKGGLRAVTGLIGRLHHDRYRMRTSIATIGIRGTGYDVLCTGACSYDNSQPENIRLPDGPGMYSYVWHGGIAVDSQELSLNQSAYKKDRNSRPQILATTPRFFRNNPAPKPGSIKIDEEQLFRQSDDPDTKPGLYVGVEEGHVIVQPHNSSNSRTIGPEQAVFVNVKGSGIRSLPSIPAFQKFDVYPKPGQLSDMNLKFIGNTRQGISSGKVCEIR